MAMRPSEPTPEERLRIMLAKVKLPERASYRLSEVALLLNLHRTTIYRRLQAGSLPHIKVGSTRRVDWATLVYLIGIEDDE